MEMTKVFRGLVASSLGLFALSIVISFLEPDFPDAVNEYLEGDGAGLLLSNLFSGPLSLQILLGALVLGFLAAYLTSCVGLLLFRRWARATFFGVAMAGIVVIPWEGVSLTTPLLSLVETLFSMIDGAILVMLLFDPIKAKFAKPLSPG